MELSGAQSHGNVSQTTHFAVNRASIPYRCGVGMPLCLQVRDGTLRVVDGPKLVAQSHDLFRAGATTFRFYLNSRMSRETLDSDILLY
jgi:hypothetical protein